MSYPYVAEAHDEVDDDDDGEFSCDSGRTCTGVFCGSRVPQTYVTLPSRCIVNKLVYVYITKKELPRECTRMNGFISRARVWKNGMSRILCSYICSFFTTFFIKADRVFFMYSCGYRLF